MGKIIPVVFMFAIMLTGATIVGLPDAFASGQGKGNDSDKGKDGHGQKGCETAKEASKGKTMNPHCGLDLCELKAEIDINGDYIREFPAPNSSQGIAINGDNYVYVSGRKPEVFDIFGNSLGKIPVPNDRYPRNIAIDMQNGVHFSNYGNVSQSPGEDFYRYDLRNTISLNKPNGLEIFERRLDFQPSFIDVDSLNRVWIADHSNGKVHVYDYYEEWFMQSSFSVGNSIYLTSEDPVGLEVAGDYLYITSHISDDLKIYEITNSPATTSPDTTPPELLFIEISTTTTAVKMSVNAHDVLSELSTVQYWLRNDSADWNIYFTGDLIEAANLRATIFESFPVAGVWKINRVTLHDTAGNSAEYYYGTDFVHDFLVP